MEILKSLTTSAHDPSAVGGMLSGACWSDRSTVMQIDDALVASMRGAVSLSEGLRAVTFDRVSGATRKDPELMRLMNALLTTHYMEKLPENLERFERYREGLSVLDGTVMYHSRVVVPVCLQEEVIKAKMWLIFADQFTGWVSVFYFEKEATAKGLDPSLEPMTHRNF